MIGTPDFPLRLADLAPSSWRWRAACRHADLADFFTDALEDVAVVDYCQPCPGPVRLACVTEELQVAPRVSNQEGVRGLTASDRRRPIRWMDARELDTWNLTLADLEAHDSHRYHQEALL